MATLTEKDYCDKDLSASLMEMGFRGFGHFYYEKDSSKLKTTHQILTVRTAKALGHTLAISLYEAQKWLREDKGLIVLVNHVITQEGDWEWTVSYRYSTDMYYSYEEALSEGIKEAVKILKQMKQYESNTALTK